MRSDADRSLFGLPTKLLIDGLISLKQTNKQTRIAIAMTRTDLPE